MPYEWQMRHAALLMITAAALASGACAQKGSSQSSGSRDTNDTSSAAAAWYTVPSGFKQKGEPLKREGWVDVAYASEDKAQIHFIVRDADSFDRTWKALVGNATSSKAPDIKEEDLPGGKGKILTYTTPEKDPRFVVSTMIRGAKNVFECEAEYRMSAPKPEVVDACKTIREP